MWFSVCVGVCAHGRVVIVRGRLWLLGVKGACAKRIFNKHMVKNEARLGRCSLMRWYMLLLCVRCFAPCMNSVLLLLIVPGLLMKYFMVAILHSE